jgi:hypothetical protein
MMASSLTCAILYAAVCHRAAALALGIKAEQYLMRSIPTAFRNVDVEVHGEVEELVELNATAHSIWPFSSSSATPCDSLVDEECREALPHEETASDKNKKLWHAPFEMKMTIGAFVNKSSESQVWHRDKMRSFDMVSSDPSLSLMRYSTMDCGDLDKSKAMTCEAQPCRPGKDPEKFGLYKNFKEIVSVGPSVLGSELKKVAVIGVAGGVMVHFLHQWSPDLIIDAVEYSPKIAKAAKECFAFPTSPNVKLTVEDGLKFLASKPNASYDWIIVDASGSLDRFGTPEAHMQYTRLVGSKGVVTFNTAGFEKFPKEVTLAAYCATYFWKGSYKTPRDFSWSFSNADLSSAEPSQLPTHANSTQHAFHVAVKKWFGAGLSTIWWETAWLGEVFR